MEGGQCDTWELHNRRTRIVDKRALARASMFRRKPSVNHPTSDQLKIVYRIPTWYGLSPVRRLPLALLTNQSFTWSLCRLLSFLLSDTRIAERVLSPRTPVHHVSDERTSCARFLVQSL